MMNVREFLCIVRSLFTYACSSTRVGLYMVGLGRVFNLYWVGRFGSNNKFQKLLGPVVKTLQKFTVLHTISYIQSVTVSNRLQVIKLNITFTEPIGLVNYRPSR